MFGQGYARTPDEQYNDPRAQALRSNNSENLKPVTAEDIQNMKEAWELVGTMLLNLASTAAGIRLSGSGTKINFGKTLASAAGRKLGTGVRYGYTKSNKRNVSKPGSLDKQFRQLKNKPPTKLR